MQLKVDQKYLEGPTQSIGDIAICECGKVFSKYRPYQKYCSDACRVKYSKGLPSRYVKRSVKERRCLRCKKPFKTNDGKRKYCSDDCALAAQAARRKPAELRHCFICGQAFKTAHWSKRYCSAECRRKARELN